MVKEEDNCDNLAAECSITKEKIQEINKHTWGSAEETVLCTQILPYCVSTSSYRVLRKSLENLRFLRTLEQEVHM
jgi:hypothetical protein